MQLVAARIQRRELRARPGEVAFQIRDLGFPARDGSMEFLERLFARDDAGVSGFAARHPDPVTAKPDAVPGDDRLARLQRLAPRYRLGQRIDRDDAAEQPADDSRAGDARGQRLGMRLRTACWS